MTKKFKTYEEASKNLDEVDLSDYGQLSLAREKDGWTVAHALVSNRELPKKFITPDILKLARTDNGWTVAHMLVNKGKKLPEKSISYDVLTLESNGVKVYEYMDEYNTDLDSVDSILGLYLLSIGKYRYPKMEFEKFKELTKKHGLEKMKKLVKLSGEKND